MQYESTRGAIRGMTSAQAILQGLAEDGGLFVPQSFPHINQEEIEALTKESYPQRASFILKKYLTDYTNEEISACAQLAYHPARFDDPDIAPLKKLTDSEFVLELWHGPTIAFKDMALQILPRLLPLAVQKTGEKDQILILVATSGDTGKAALDGFCNVAGTRIAVFYPQEGVSQAQKMQMVTQSGQNVHVVAVKGNFDDAQNGVKRIFVDEGIQTEIKQKGYRFSSANSINWGRLVPQIAYYFSAYADLLKQKAIQAGEKINFVVPTGNFGNILAGYYAMRMGLPVNKFICASNCNNVLTDFFQKQVYDKNRPFFKTASPSMDILISSNLERLLYEMSGRNGEKVSAWMKKLKQEGKYEIDEKYGEWLREFFYAGFADEEATKQIVKETFEKYGYVMDPHTAVGQAVYERYVSETADKTVAVLVSTASPYKFCKDVVGALEPIQETVDEFELAKRLHVLSGLVIPKAITELEGKPVLHQAVCTPEMMMDELRNFL